MPAVYQTPGPIVPLCHKVNVLTATGLFCNMFFCIVRCDLVAIEINTFSFIELFLRNVELKSSSLHLVYTIN